MDWQSAYQRSVGYFDLEMFEDALEEVDRYPDQRELLAYRHLLFVNLERWGDGAALGAVLVEMEPAEVQNWINWAYCVRRADSLDAAKVILIAAAGKFPEDALIQYNLGCYACVLGDHEGAKVFLKRAFIMDAEWRVNALHDEDLVALLDVIPEL